ncbi:MAG: UDP-N-acetylmuramoyl-L-alanine--D-glutamate ligase [Chloroflexi bacterium]|nr:UDP-N-acetylmuramoyl-L-alanine--D-glutamate ligase [Chloroflexota bacterium]
MSNNPFAGQNILIVGLAREGAVAARWLAERGANVLVSDLRSCEQLTQSLANLAPLGVQSRLGPQTLDLLADIDAIIVSPGVPQDIPLLISARERNLPLSSEPRLFAQHCPAPIIGVTGSSGKTTTTTLTARMVEASAFRTWLGGNIGTPLLSHLHEISSEDRVAMELSSFQLLYWSEQSTSVPGNFPWQHGQGISPHIAAILNITPNHLDRHPSMSHYTAAKTAIVAYQTAADVAVLSHDDPATAAWAETGRVSIAVGSGQEKCEFRLNGRIQTFGLSGEPANEGAWIEGQHIWLSQQGITQPILPISEIRLRGRHNWLNILAACCLATAAHADAGALAEVIRDFSGIEHRLEVVRQHEGVMWINDSIATSPERAIAALNSFEEPLILLAGGRDKHLPWDGWANKVYQRARSVITFGEAATVIEQALHPIPRHAYLKEIYSSEDLQHAVELAATLARPGDVVLLSPGDTSYDAYGDFAARGQHYRDLVKQLT